LVEGDPVLAGELADVLENYLVKSTRDNYNSVSSSFERFCSIRGMEPYPVDQIKLCGWILRLMTSVKPTSLKSYLAGVRFVHINKGYEWTLTGNECVRRVIRYVKRTFPCGGKALKVPISLDVLRRILPLLPGWPDLDALSMSDLLFAAASVIAVLGFLRGGEFLHKSNQTRPILKFSDVSLRTVRNVEALVVGIPQAKATWWLTHALVPVFPTCEGDPFCPVRLWKKLISRSAYVSATGVPSSPSLPAFHDASGAPLGHGAMVSHTLLLLGKAGFCLVDDSGQPTTVKASSWRAGGVRSAVDAGLPEQMIMDLGRWKSSAWASYLLHTHGDLREASASMWSAAGVSVSDDVASPHTRHLRVVREVSPGPMSASVENSEVQGVLARIASVPVSSLTMLRVPPPPGVG
jgi:hypothetical protein